MGLALKTLRSRAMTITRNIRENKVWPGRDPGSQVGRHICCVASVPKAPGRPSDVYPVREEKGHVHRGGRIPHTPAHTARNCTWCGLRQQPGAVPQDTQASTSMGLEHAHV